MSLLMRDAEMQLAALMFLPPSTCLRARRTLRTQSFALTLVRHRRIVRDRRRHRLCSHRAMRKLLRRQETAARGDFTAPKAPCDNPSAFMAASMQGVIEKLRAQEKELARLHRSSRNARSESERITEEVTRNMPTGLLLVNCHGRDHSSESRGGRRAGR